jgi:uncharacterized protein
MAPLNLMPNLLSAETSPYLLQHADNPVDWHPWDDAAFERARAEDKPVLLSIGYAACHWCHVMAHESFEDTETARLMNEYFVNIKVDREERPDVDGIYMQAVQAMTGRGGWPMTVFLTADRAPFYGGTYFPPEDRHGMPSFRKVLLAVADAWRNRRESILTATDQIGGIYTAAGSPASDGDLDAHALDLAFRAFAQAYDARHGGFGVAPKFPPTMGLDFLLRYWKRTGTTHALEMALDTFRQMARGGIHDQIGGGFARYSVDAHWLVPHFEKMLYDNALLVRLGADLWRATKDTEVRSVTEDALRWVKREMTSAEGGFYSSLDADSEGEEGRYYVWTEAELDELLGEDSAVVKLHYDVTAEGNFEGANILHVAGSADLVAARGGMSADAVRAAVARARQRLLAARETRVRPGLDDKILACWNGLMLRGVMEAAFAFGAHEWLELGMRNAAFLDRELVRAGRVWRVHKHGVTRIPGFLEDQAAVALAFLSVYSVTCDTVWLARARELADRMLELFRDAATGMLYDTSHDAERLIARPREVTDNALPAGTSMAAELLLRLGELDDDQRRIADARAMVESTAGMMARHPSAFGHLLGVADSLVHGSVQVAIAGDPEDGRFRALARVAAETFVPGLVLAGGDPGGPDTPALLRGRSPAVDGATAHVCRNFVCDLPTSDATELERQLASAARPAFRDPH